MGDNRGLGTGILIGAVAVALILAGLSGSLPAATYALVKGILVIAAICVVLVAGVIVAYLIFANKKREEEESMKYNDMPIINPDEQALLNKYSDGDQPSEMDKWQAEQRKRFVEGRSGATVHSSSSEEAAGTRYNMMQSSPSQLGGASRNRQQTGNEVADDK